MKRVAILIAMLISMALLLVGCDESDISNNPHGGVPVSQKSGYQLRFSDEFNNGMNSINNMGISVVIAVDISGSMNDTPRSGSSEQKYIQATDALKSVVKYLADVHKKNPNLLINVSLMKFSDDPTILFPMKMITDKSLNDLNSICEYDNFHPYAGTAIGKAMETCSEQLAQSGTILNSMIIITDGQNSVGQDPINVIDGIYSNNNNKCTKDLEVYTSTQIINFIGFDVDDSTFSELEKHGANVTSASNKDQLGKALKDLLEADITKLES